MKRKFLICISILAALLSFGYLANGSILGIIYWDGPYHGRVVDAETGEPIAGAAVAGIWEFEHYVFMSISSFANATETVTDADGRFDLPRIWAFTPWLLTARLEITDLLVFKPGYDSHPPVMYYVWTPLEERDKGITKQEYQEQYWIRCYRGEECLVRLNKPSTIKERKAVAGVSVDVPVQERWKIKNTLKLINKKRVELGANKRQVYPSN